MTGQDYDHDWLNTMTMIEAKIDHYWPWLAKTMTMTDNYWPRLAMTDQGYDQD